MCKGERPIGATKGKQPNTMALCQPPPPPYDDRHQHFPSSMLSYVGVCLCASVDNATRSSVRDGAGRLNVVCCGQGGAG